MKKEELPMIIQMFIDSFTKDMGQPPTIAQINDFLSHHARSVNSIARDEFDGYSSDQMHQLVYGLWESDSLITLNPLTEEEYMQIPLLRQILKLGDILSVAEKVKLTATGSLPTAIVREVYSVGTPDSYIEKEQIKRLMESDSVTVQRTVIMMKLMGVIKVQKGILTLTVRGKKMLGDKHQLLSGLFQSFTQKFNWGYFDSYPNEAIGKIGAGFSLAMMAKYGADWKPDIFYAEKYFKVFPDLKTESSSFREKVPGQNCYAVRTFPRFMLEFGLIECKKQKAEFDYKGYIAFDFEKYTRKTPLFDRMLTIK